MSSLLFLPRIVKVLVFFAGVQFYLAQSLVMVEHCNSGGRGNIQTRQRSSTCPLVWGHAKRIHDQYTATATATQLVRQRKDGCAYSTTAIFFSSTDINNNNEDGSSSSSSSSVEKSLNEILNELTDRGIAFSPLASRAELAELLEKETETDSAGFSSSTNTEPENEHRTERRNPTPEQQQQQQQQQPFRPPTTAMSEGERRNEHPNQERNKQIQDRVQRRANRTRRSSTQKGTVDEERMEDYPLSSSSTSRQRRQRRREGEVRDDGIQEDTFDNNYDYDYVDGTNSDERRSSDGTRLRRRLRRQRLEQRPSSLLESISSPVSDMVDMGARASRIARRKTGKIFKDLVESTYDDDYDYGDDYGDDYGEDDDTGVRQNQSRSGQADRRERRRSGFNWQQPPRSMGNDGSQRKQRRRQQSTRIDERGTVAAAAAADADAADADDEPPSANYYSSDKNNATGREEFLQKQKREQRPKARQPRQRQPSEHENETPSVNYYSSDKNEATGREEFLRKQKREPRQKARQPRQRQPSEDEKIGKQTSSSARSRLGSFAKRTSDDLRSRIRKKMPIGQILAALDERNISYSPKASRSELEDLLLDGLGDNNNDVVAVKKAKEDIEVIEVESISPEDWKRQQEEKLQQKQKEQEQNEKRKKNQQTNAIDTGDNPAKGGTTASSANDIHRRSVHNSYRSSGFSATTAKAYGSGFTGRQRRRRQDRPEETQRTAAGAAADATSSSPSPSSPRSSSSSFENPSDSSTSRTKVAEDGAASRPQTNRRIYSPYGRTQSESAGTEPQSTRSAGRNKRKKSNDFADIEDDFDRFSEAVEDDLGKFGDFLGESVDSIFWGTADEESSPMPEGQEGRESFDSRDPKRRHWKDRAEERLDKMMGVHKAGGKSYDRWAEKETSDFAEDSARDYDAFSYTKGRTRKGGRKGRRSRKAFWEEDDSVLSTLLGHNWDDSRPPQRSFKSNLDDIRGALRSSNNLTALLRNLLAVSTRIIGSICRWASVRDTIPRPVVLLGAVGSGFVSRPGSRIKNSVLAFLSIRVLGEWLSEPNRRDDQRRPRRGRGSFEKEEDDDDCEAVE